MRKVEHHRHQADRVKEKGINKHLESAAFVAPAARRKHTKTGFPVIFIQHPGNGPEMWELPDKLPRKHHPAQQRNFTETAGCRHTAQQWGDSTWESPYKYGKRSFSFQRSINDSIKQQGQHSQHPAQGI